ncbi:hypothetical protein AB0F18_14835 [Streptomyces sp. NPDC029216]|uniref:hypothetical protein n=1 Tax=Streptomyces sp. NPDC029216 TaxID=3154701 RepID=UPI00341171A2
MSSTRIRLAALGAAVLGTIALAGPAQATDTTAAQTRAAFSTQAHEAGLNDGQAAELQRRVDAEVATTGGRQIAANKIALDRDAKTVMLLTLPGEARARELSGPEASFADPCARGWACLYPYPDFEGNAIKMYDCGKVGNPWYGTGSWVNNQPSNYHMKFYDRSGRLGWTSPGGYSADANAPLDWVGYVSAC